MSFVGQGLLQHGDEMGAGHMGGSSVWMVISMIAFSIFLLWIAWSLIRPSRGSDPTAADTVARRYGHGEIDDDEFQRALIDIRSRRT
ncbi:hypothetical protein [Ilumatobacter nonamiensis]|uniref:hypothetical protein n=1 Tax=Ilumatobacter nonamiensis TaxID=467093 RepID=UPI0011D260C2|nr:hypothetical protein [Ilumatobacter nonamiensis]